MKDKQFTTRFPIHKAVDETEDEMNTIQELSQQRPLHHGERADTMYNDAYCDVPQASDDEEDDVADELGLPPYGASDKTKQKMAKEMGEAEFEEMQGDLLNADRKKQNVDEIASTIMQMIDAVDADENTKIKTICIEIGLE